MGGLFTALAKLKTVQHQKFRYVTTCSLIIGYCKQIGFQFRFKSFQWDVRSFTGSEFHSVGPETAKLRGPMRTVRVRGTARFPCVADHRCWEPLPTGEIISARYEGAAPCSHL